MKKYLLIFNVQTAVIIILSLLSCYLTVYFQFKIYADFLLLGILIVFPLTFTMRAAFRRRERSLQYLSLLKATLQSVFYSFQNSTLEEYKKTEFGNIANNLSATLIQYLSGASQEVAAVERARQAMITFILQNKKAIKKTSDRIILFVFRINESIEFLLSVRRHNTPWGPRTIILLAIYLFAIFYPPSALFSGGTELQMWNLVFMTGFKVLFLISFYNVQVLMEDPFNQNSPDGIRLNDFQFSRETISPARMPSMVSPPQLNKMGKL